jgi:UDP-4-amino-4,6-dideoxy-N-acetyl-beta-L-altrosamine transaminase
MTDGAGRVPLLPYGRHWVEDDDIAAVVETLRGPYLTTGPVVRRFEEAFAARVGARFAVAVSSGTAALHLAMIAADLGPGDRAVVPSMTFLATANVVRFTGAEVVFADVDAESGLLTPETLAAALDRAGGQVKAVIPVHLGGAVADMAAIAARAAAAGAVVIEDACHAIGATAPSAAVGACPHSAMAAFSTHPVKTIATGEGGMITLNDAERAARLARLRSHGMDYDRTHWRAPERSLDGGERAPWYYEMAEMGFNYRLTDIASALGLSQLAKLDRFLDRRSTLAARYDRALAPLAPHVRPPVRSMALQPGWHLYAVRIDFAALGTTRSAVMARLREEGIATQVHYIPVHTQPYYRARYGPIDLPGADTYFQRTLTLPLFPAMRDDDLERVVSALARALGLG